MRTGWSIKIDLTDIWDDDDMPFIARRDEIIKRIKASGWSARRRRLYPAHDDYDPFTELIEEISETEDKDEFDAVWDEVYDHADRDRVWLGTIL